MPRTYTICCNLPHGVHLQRHTFKKRQEGQVLIDAPEPVGPRVTLNGANHHSAIGGRTIMVDRMARTVEGWGVTDNVDADWFDAWLKENHDISFVKNGNILIHEKPAHAEAKAKEKGPTKTGFESIDPESHGVKDAEK